MVFAKYQKIRAKGASWTGPSHKYNSRKVLSFVATEGAGRNTLGVTYLSKYPDQFSNVSIRLVDCPPLMFKFYCLVNEVESHNKSQQLDIVLVKF